MKNKFPFSTSMKVGKFVFVSGKIGMDSVSKEIARGDVFTQTKQILKNLACELKQHGMDMGDVVKTTVFLTDMQYFKEMNIAYVTGFKEPLPTRSCISVSDLPNADALVEIECIAYRKEK